MAVMSQDYRIRSLNHRILESLLDSVAAHVGENSGAGPLGFPPLNPSSSNPVPPAFAFAIPKLRAQIADGAVEFGAVIQLDMVHTKANIIQQVRTEGVAPVHHVIVDRRIREACAQQGKRIDRRVVLLGVRKAAKNMVVIRGIEINLDVVLVVLTSPVWM